MRTRRRRTGLVLTNAPTIDDVDLVLRLGGYDALKVITPWGLDEGWNPRTIRRAMFLAPEVIVRTKAGDPSVDGRWGGNFTFIDQHRVEAEIAPFYAARSDIWIELGNEPNIYPLTGTRIYEYAYFLGTAIDLCARRFPDARLIAPAVSFHHDKAEQFMRICQLQMARCHAIGLHAYEWTTFDGPVAGRKGELDRALALAGELFPTKDWWLTEYGIHGPELTPETKGARYAALLGRQTLPKNLVGATYYHLSVGGAPCIQPEYHLGARGDLAHHQARYQAA